MAICTRCDQSVAHLGHKRSRLQDESRINVDKLNQAVANLDKQKKQFDKNMTASVKQAIVEEFGGGKLKLPEGSEYWKNLINDHK